MSCKAKRTTQTKKRIWHLRMYKQRRSLYEIYGKHVCWFNEACEERVNKKHIHSSHTSFNEHTCLPHISFRQRLCLYSWTFHMRCSLFEFFAIFAVLSKITALVTTVHFIAWNYSNILVFFIVKFDFFYRLIVKKNYKLHSFMSSKNSKKNKKISVIQALVHFF